MLQKDKQQRDLPSNKFIRVAIDILSYSSRLEHFISVTLKPFNLTLPQFNVLCVLTSHHPKPIVLKKLTEAMIDKSSNTSRLVDKLVEKNCVARQPDSTDRRIIHISITETGLTLTNQASESLSMELESRLSKSENEEPQQLIGEAMILRG